MALDIIFDQVLEVFWVMFCEQEILRSFQKQLSIDNRNELTKVETPLLGDQTLTIPQVVVCGKYAAITSWAGQEGSLSLYLWEESI